MEANRNLYQRIFDSLKKTYDKRKNRYQDIRDLLAPGTGVFSESDEAENLSVDYKKQLDSEPASYLDTTTAGLYGGLINPASRWFDLTIDKTKKRNMHMDYYTLAQGLENVR